MQASVLVIEAALNFLQHRDCSQAGWGFRNFTETSALLLKSVGSCLKHALLPFYQRPDLVLSNLSIQLLKRSGCCSAMLLHHALLRVKSWCLKFDQLFVSLLLLAALVDQLVHLVVCEVLVDRLVEMVVILVQFTLHTGLKFAIRPNDKHRSHLATRFLTVVLEQNLIFAAGCWLLSTRAIYADSAGVLEPAQTIEHGKVRRIRFQLHCRQLIIDF